MLGLSVNLFGLDVRDFRLGLLQIRLGLCDCGLRSGLRGLETALGFLHLKLLVAQHVVVYRTACRKKTDEAGLCESAYYCAHISLPPGLCMRTGPGLS